MAKATAMFTKTNAKEAHKSKTPWGQVKKNSLPLGIWMGFVSFGLILVSLCYRFFAQTHANTPSVLALVLALASRGAEVQRCRSAEVVQCLPLFVWLVRCLCGGLLLLLQCCLLDWIKSQHWWDGKWKTLACARCDAARQCMHHE